MHAETLLADCRGQGEVAATRLGHGGMRFRSKLLHPATKTECTLTQYFTPAIGGIRWVIEIEAEGPPWSTGIVTRLRYPATPQTRFWTAWSDPEHRDEGWRNPLCLRPLANHWWTYQGLQTAGDNMAIPMVTLAEPREDVGLSLALSPEDTLLDLRLRHAQSGEIDFTRTRHRLGEGRMVRFAMDLVVHPADWRAGMRLDGEPICAVLRPAQRPGRSDGRLRGLLGRRASDRRREAPADGLPHQLEVRRGFPYMGMFLPPLEDEDARWDRALDEAAQPRQTALQFLPQPQRLLPPDAAKTASTC